ncbi:unnamed protein product [Trichobilharzia regenti]|nr:unnamed protein product [Trichobilharzia regenti]
MVNSHQSSWANQQGNNPPALLEASNFGSLQVPVHRESTGNYTTTWYTANVTGLQPSTYYVVQLKAVSPSGSGDKATSRPVKTWDERKFYLPLKYDYLNFQKNGYRNEEYSFR